MNPTDGWTNFADYLALNKDASQRQLQGVLDEQAPNAEMIRSNAQRQFANAGQLGFEGNDINQGHGGEQEKLMMDYGQFVEGLSDPSRLQAYFAKHGAGGNSALDAGLASVAGAGQIQEAQKGLTALQNYVTEKGVDAQERYATGQQAKQNVSLQEQARLDSNARLSRDPAKAMQDRQLQAQRWGNQRNQAALDTSGKYGDNWGGRADYASSTGELRKAYDTDIKTNDPLGRRFARAAPQNPYPSWWKKP